MAIFGDPNQHLAELGKQLTCPICLNLLKTAVNLTCNHIFCRPCITEAMKTASSCPVCKVPSSKREVRCAPHMDSMVVVYRQMEAAAGVQICCTQPSQAPDQQTEANKLLPKEGELDDFHDDELKLMKSTGGKRSPPEGSDLRTEERLKRKEKERGKDSVAVKTPVSTEGRKMGSISSPERFDGKISPKTTRQMNMEVGSTRDITVGQSSLTPVPVKKRTQLIFSDDGLIREEEDVLIRGGNLPVRQMNRRVFDKTEGEKVGEGEGDFCEIPGRGNPLVSSPTPSPEVSPGSVKRTLEEKQRVQVIRPFKKTLSAGTWSLVGCQTEAKVEKKNPLDGKPKSDMLTERIVDKVCQGETSNSRVPLGCSLEDKEKDKKVNKEDEFEEEAKVQETPWETAETFSGTPYFTGEEDKLGGSDYMTDPKTPAALVLNKESETRYLGKEERFHKGTGSDHLGVRHLVKAVKGWLTGEIGGNSRNSEITGDQSDILENGKKVLTGDERGMSSNQVRQKPVMVSGRVKRSFGNMDSHPSDRLDPADMAGGSDNGCKIDRVGYSPIIANAGLEAARKETEPKIQVEADSQPDWMVEKSKKTPESKPVTMYTRRLQHECDTDSPGKDVRLPDLKKNKTYEELKPLASVSGGQQKATLEKCKRKRDEAGDDDCREKEGFFEQESSQGGLCSFCGTSGISKVTGDMVQVDCRGGRIMRDMSIKRHRIQLVGECVHENCLEWAPDVFFQGEKVKNLLPELHRAQRLRCSECGVKGAALGCCLPKCRKTYHYPCARKVTGCRWDEDNFIMLCPEHASGGFPCNNSGEQQSPVKVKNENPVHRSKKLDSRQGTGSGDNGKWPSCSSSSTWVICGSGLDASGREELVRFAAMTGSSYVKEWCPSITHVVTGLDGKGRARRTLKFLSAILKGQWVISLKWLAACKKAGKPVSEEAFEVKMDVHDMIGGPKRGRLLSPEKKLFEGMSLYFFGEFDSPSKEDLASVFVVGGGTILQRKPIPLFSDEEQKPPRPNTSLVILFNDFNTLLASPRKHSAALDVRENAKKMAKDLLGFALPHTWLLDSAAKCQILSFDGYKAHGEN